jgi:two-component system OmpR family sensor kinase
MIKSIRGRLQWWYGAVYALSILAFGLLVYWRADRDAHERATLQAVSTVQYLDVSLRNVPPHLIRHAPQDSDFGPGETIRENFTLGPLPPEFQFRPPRGRDGGPEGEQRPRPGRPDFAEYSEDGQGGNPPTPDEHRRPPRGPGNDFRPERSDRDPDGPRGNSPNGPPEGPRFPPEEGDRLKAVRPPATNEGPPFDGDDSRVDRMEFVVWRGDGSVLTRSDGMPLDQASMMPNIELGNPAPQVSMNRGEIEVTKRGPHGSVIRVIRSFDRDLSNLHRFGIQISGMAVLTLVVGIVGGWWISGRIVRPIQMISETAAQISATSLNRRIETMALDQELIQLGTVLNATFGRLEHSFARLTQFTADASHELRTPLAVIQSQMELALGKPRTPEAYQQTLEICLKSSDRMRSLIDGLLLLARTDAERLEMRPVPVDLRDIAEDAISQLQDKATAAEIELECVVPEDNLNIMADSRFLAQIPANLIDNAIQHTPAGGKISLEVRRDGDKAVLTVKDTGCGIAAEHIPHLFERFYRIDAGRSRRHGGSGLGLAICRSLVEAHNGTITCESKLGEGSVFKVCLPIASDVEVPVIEVPVDGESHV